MSAPGARTPASGSDARDGVLTSAAGGYGLRAATLFGTALREAPADVDIASHRLLVRGGYVRQLAAGIFSYLPLAWRSIRKIEQILREELERIGAQELSMPVVHPAEPWQASGRWYEIDETMARFTDRRARDMLLAMTHEEVVAQLAASEVNSYRQLPLLVFQMQTKYRDELRARGGLIRVREFIMKDSYSLDRDPEGLERQYWAHYEAYERIGARVGLPLLPVQSDVGMMGGKVAHEFMYVTPIGEDSLVVCRMCGYAANRDVAAFGRTDPQHEDPDPLERVHTPGTGTIAELAELLGIPAERTGKVVFYLGTFADEDSDAEHLGRLVACLVRGDMEVNPIQLQKLTGATALRPAREEEIRAAGMEPGFASPIGIPADAALVVADDLVAGSPNLVLGANEPDHHLTGTNAGRDYAPHITGPVASAYPGAPCAECGAALELVRGVEVGNIFQLGTRYSEALGASFHDEDGSERPIHMGSYGIGVGRLLACVAEECCDDRGLALPVPVAPLHVSLVSLARSAETAEIGERLFREMVGAGLEVLYDDREASPGAKLAEADLRGLPLRAILSERSLEQNAVELKRRTEADGRLVALDEIIPAIEAELTALCEPIEAALARLGS